MGELVQLFIERDIYSEEKRKISYKETEKLLREAFKICDNDKKHAIFWTIHAHVYVTKRDLDS